MEENMRKFGNLLLGTLIGGLVGSSIALLFAPASGEETRREIDQYFKNLQAEVARAADEKRAELEAELDKLRSGKNVTIEEKSA
jgi:gas vesicle protein